MTEQELIDFLTTNLQLTATNTPSPWDGSDHFTVSLVLNGNTISQVVLDVNDGDN